MEKKTKMNEQSKSAMRSWIIHQVEKTDKPHDEIKREFLKKYGSQHADYFESVVSELVEDNDINIIDEAVTVQYDRYIRSHGKKPRDTGSGRWMFTTKRMGEPNDDEIFTLDFGSLADAKKAAKKWAKSKNVTDVYVMEDINLDEAESMRTRLPSKSELMAQMVAYAASLNRENLAKAVDQVSHDIDKIYNKVTKTDVDDSDAKQNMATINSVDSLSMREDIAEIFGSDELSEDFKLRTETLFEAAVNTRVNLERVRLEEEFAVRLTEAEENFQTELEESVERVIDETEDKVNDYLSYAVNEWVEENRLEIRNRLRTEIVESFLNGLKNLYTEHYVEIPDDKVDIVESLAERVSALETQINEKVDETIELRNTIEEMEVREAIAELSEGLTLTQRDRFSDLVENITYSDVADFRKRAEVILENYIEEDTTNSDAENLLNEEVQVQHEQKKSTSDPVIMQYAEALKRTVKR